MNRVICVYSSSSCSIDRLFFEAAELLGAEIAKNGDTLLFGGGMRGLMGATARAAHLNSGRVVGIIPEALNIKGVVYEYCDELVVTPGLRERKALMDARSDAFIALPGGYGTLEELLEIITLKQLKYHNKPVVILNTGSFYDCLLRQFDRITDMGFAMEVFKGLYYIADTAGDALRYIEEYTPLEFSVKWDEG